MEEKLIGNYRVLKKLGAGGMARVYLAVHKDVPNLKVVLKILTDPRLVERFRHEADKLALLDGHAGICRIKHFFNHGDEMAIAMEYIDGVTLDEYLKATERLPIPDAIRIVLAVLDILQFAHQKDIYHRDIKPSNIMMNKQDEVKIIDFGIAKSKTDPSLTLAGTAAGTPAYMAPEQFTPSDDLDYSLVDVYACGITLYHLVTGELPFEGENEFVIRDAKLFGEPSKPRQKNPSVPKAVESVIMKAMHKAPEQRYQSVGEMAAELRQILGGMTDTEKTAPMVPTREVVAQKKGEGGSGGMKWGAIGIGAVVVVVLAVAAWMFWPGEPSAPPPEPPRAVAPPDGARLNDPSAVQLAWTATGGAGAEYVVQWSSDSTFDDGGRIERLARNSFTPPEPLDTGQYFWRVKAVTTAGVEGAFSAIRSFRLAAQPQQPAEGVLVVSVNEADGTAYYLNDQLVGRNEPQLTMTLDSGDYELVVVNGRSQEKRLRYEFIMLPDDTVSRNAQFSITPTRQQEERPDRPREDQPVTTEPTGPATGTLIVASPPYKGGDIYLNGLMTGHQTPFAVEQVEAGTIRVEVRWPDTEEGANPANRDTTVTLEAAERLRVIFRYDD